jgi:hypothetical protein
VNHGVVPFFVSVPAFMVWVGGQGLKASVGGICTLSSVVLVAMGKPFAPGRVYYEAVL